MYIATYGKKKRPAKLKGNPINNYSGAAIQVEITELNQPEG
jgi:hypothetical protein